MNPILFAQIYDDFMVCDKAPDWILDEIIRLVRGSQILDAGSQTLLAVARIKVVFSRTMQCYTTLLMFVLLLVLARAQSLNLNDSQLCPSSVFNNANATGTISLDLNDYTYDAGGNPNLTLSMTISTCSGIGNYNVSFPIVNTTLWVGQPPGINLYSGSNGYSACGFMFTNLPINTIEKGQNDDGSCHQTLSPACVETLTQQVADFALYQTMSFTGGPFSNLTPPILDYFCTNIQSAIAQYTGGQWPTEHQVSYTFPKECQPYLDDGSIGFPETIHFEMTSNSTDEWLPVDWEETCWIENTTLGQGSGYTLREAYSGYQNLTSDLATQKVVYDNATRNVIPVLSVFFPQANNTRSEATDRSWAQMTCLRAETYSKGSRVAAVLPSPTPVHISEPLSKGAKAGIAVGVIADVVIIITGIWLILKGSRKWEVRATTQGNGSAKDGAVMLMSVQKHEIAGDHALEADGRAMQDIRSAVPRELEGQAHHHNRSPVEMYG